MKGLTKIFSVVLSLVMLGTLALPFSSRAFAQDALDDYVTTDYDYTDDFTTTYDYDYSYDDVNELSEEAATGLGIAMIAVWCFAVGFGLLNMVFFLISLIHCIQNAPDDKKTMWILIILFVPFGAWVYFFTKRKEWGKKGATASATPVQPATAS